jgi:pilus assembly protein Flp/PilA
MKAPTWLRNPETRLASTYVRVREAARRPLDRSQSRGEEGQGLAEYALIAVLIAIVVILVLATIGGKVKNLFSNVSNGLNA